MKLKKKKKIFKPTKKYLRNKEYQKLRHKILIRFNIENKQIPVLTDDCDDLYIVINLIYNTQEGEKITKLCITTSNINYMLFSPEIRNKLNIKTVGKFFCIYFNKEDPDEFIKAYAHFHSEVTPNKIKIHTDAEDFFKPFVYVISNWSHKSFFKNMDNGNEQIGESKFPTLATHRADSMRDLLSRLE